MLTDLVQIRRLGEKKRDENSRLRLHLKRRNYQERRLLRIARDIEEQIDCTACANCCRVATIKIIDRDAEKLARYFGITKSRFLAEYALEDAEEGRVLKRNEGGCVFLEGNLCSIYDVRPHTCQTFPHLTHGAGSLVSRLWEMPDRACYCPIVYNTLEAWKTDLGLKPVSGASR
jgi:Fe-S-cluster containining protein